MWKHSRIPVGFIAIGIVVLASCLALTERPNYRDTWGSYWGDSGWWDSGDDEYGTCDERSSCGSCAECTMGAGCEPEYDACVNHSGCMALVECLVDCESLPDASAGACVEDCAETYPTGTQGYLDLYYCIHCDECLTSCDVVSPSSCP